MRKLLVVFFLLNINIARAGNDIFNVVSDERELDRLALFQSNSSPKIKWKDFNPQNYVFVIKNGGNGNELNSFPLVQITVLGGKIHRVINLHPTMNKDFEPEPKNFRTIPELFDFIDEQYSKGPMTVEVKHHWNYAYPMKIVIDRTIMPHDEVLIEIIEFDIVKKSN